MEKKTLSVNIVKSNTIVLRDKEREKDGLDIGSAECDWHFKKPYTILYIPRLVPPHIILSYKKLRNILLN